MGKLCSRRITWSDLWQSDFSHLRYQIQAVYNVLLSPSNLHTWDKSDTPACQLCRGKGSLQHLLSGCTRSLSEGHYRWRHNQVLKATAEVVSEAIKLNEFKPRRHESKSKVMLLSSMSDWQLVVDLERQIKFPANIVETKLRPDIIMYSNSMKKVIMWELLVPWEENMESTHERNITKYEPLIEQCRVNG